MSELRKKVLGLLEKHIKDGSKDLPQGIRVERKDWTNFAVAGTIRPDLLKAILPEEAEKIEKAQGEAFANARKIVTKITLGGKDGEPLTPAILAKSIKDGIESQKDTDAIVKSLADAGYTVTAGTVALVKSALSHPKIAGVEKPPTHDTSGGKAAMLHGKELEKWFGGIGGVSNEEIKELKDAKTPEEQEKVKGKIQARVKGAKKPEEVKKAEDAGAEKPLCKAEGCKEMAKGDSGLCEKHSA